MSLKDTLNEDLKTAMKAKDQVALRTLRAIKSAILLAETAEGRQAGTALTEAEEIELLTRQLKQRKDSMEQYQTHGRPDLAEAEEAEIGILQRYLPSQLEGEDLNEALRQIIAEVGASGPEDFGLVMKAASSSLKGRADGKAISAAVKQLL